MPHEFVSGVFGASRPAWHGLGEVREGLLTTDEALMLSGVAEVEATPEPIYARDGSGEYREIPGWLAVTRTSNGDVLGVHSGTYAVENFVDAFRALGFADDAKVWETMILLRGGRNWFDAGFEGAGKKGGREGVKKRIPNQLRL